MADRYLFLGHRIEARLLTQSIGLISCLFARAIGAGLCALRRSGEHGCSAPKDQTFIGRRLRTGDGMDAGSRTAKLRRDPSPEETEKPEYQTCQQREPIARTNGRVVVPVCAVAEARRRVKGVLGGRQKMTAQ
ncbi:hypothetical protein [Bradyrhizobium brasilense]|uniref:hypothetical protein n=1 Tax=Bradyrhizobium brasilense TaxID=1419277 RepID=UPI00115FC786|nr:hypothetical protein [Bradyrhizobium brasilense]